MKEVNDGSGEEAVVDAHRDKENEEENVRLNRKRRERGRGGEISSNFIRIRAPVRKSIVSVSFYAIPSHLFYFLYPESEFYFERCVV